MTVEQLQAVKADDALYCVFTAAVYVLAREQGDISLPAPTEACGGFTEEVYQKAIDTLLRMEGQKELAQKVAAFIKEEVCVKCSGNPGEGMRKWGDSK